MPVNTTKLSKEWEYALTERTQSLS